MLCEQILFNLDEHPAGWAEERGLDFVDLHWSELSRRALRKQTRTGVEVRILLSLGVRLRHGDVIGAHPDRFIAIDVTPCEVWIVRRDDPSTLALAALELGNLHIPAEVNANGELIVCPDGPAAGVFKRYALVWQTGIRRFAPLRCEGLIVKAASDFAIRKTSTSTYEKTGI